MEIVVISIPALHVDHVNRITAGGPHIVVIDPSGHDRDKDVARAQRGQIYLFHLEGGHRIAETV